VARARDATPPRRGALVGSAGWKSLEGIAGPPPVPRVCREGVSRGRRWRGSTTTRRMRASTQTERMTGFSCRRSSPVASISPKGRLNRKRSLYPLTPSTSSACNQKPALTGFKWLSCRRAWASSRQGLCTKLSPIQGLPQAPVVPESASRRCC